MLVVNASNLDALEEQLPLATWEIVVSVCPVLLIHLAICLPADLQPGDPVNPITSPNKCQGEEEVQLMATTTMRSMRMLRLARQFFAERCTIILSILDG